MKEGFLREFLFVLFFLLPTSSTTSVYLIFESKKLVSSSWAKETLLLGNLLFISSLEWKVRSKDASLSLKAFQLGPSGEERKVARE